MKISDPAWGRAHLNGCVRNLGGGSGGGGPGGSEIPGWDGSGERAINGLEYPLGRILWGRALCLWLWEYPGFATTLPFPTHPYLSPCTCTCTQSWIRRRTSITPCWPRPTSCCSSTRWWSCTASPRRTWRRTTGAGQWWRKTRWLGGCRCRRGGRIAGRTTSAQVVCVGCGGGGSRQVAGGAYLSWLQEGPSLRCILWGYALVGDLKAAVLHMLIPEPPCPPPSGWSRAAWTSA